VQLTLVQNNALFQGASAATGPLPQDVVFSSDGSRLYVGNNAGGSISVFAVSAQGAALQPLQTAQLPVAAGEFAPDVVRVTLSASGRKFAATTPDGRLFVGNVSPMDGTLSGFTETLLGTNANLEEVVFDPSAQNVYTADQDNGGIFGFSLAAGAPAPLPNSPFSTGTLPGGPTGMAFNSAGHDRAGGVHVLARHEQRPTCADRRCGQHRRVSGRTHRACSGTLRVNGDP
jgi:DNA-binding beta-propeller fold protein YncE